MINLKGVYWGGMRMAGKAEDRELTMGCRAELSRTCGWGAFLAEDAFGSLLSNQVWRSGRGSGGDPRSKTRNNSEQPWWRNNSLEISVWRISRYADELKKGRCEGWTGANSVEEGGHAHRDRQMGKHETERKGNTKEIIEGKCRGHDRQQLSDSIYTTYCICIISLWVLHSEIWRTLFMQQIILFCLHPFQLTSGL